MIEEKIFDMLLNETIFEVVEDRIFPLMAPEQTLSPYIVFSIPNETWGHTMAGSDNCHILSLQITAWGQTYQEATLLKNIVLSVFDSYKDDKDNPSVTDDFDVFIQSIFCQNVSDIMDYNSAVDNSLKIGKRMDFEISFELLDV